MTLSILPRTRPGRWSFGLITATEFAIVGILSVQAMGDPLRVGVGDGLLGRPLLALFAVSAAAGAVAAIVTGVYAMLGRHERGLSVVGAVLIGLVVAAFAVGEVLS